MRLSLSLSLVLFCAFFNNACECYGKEFRNNTGCDIWVAEYYADQVYPGNIATGRNDRYDYAVRGWKKVAPLETLKSSAKGIYAMGRRANGNAFQVMPSIPYKSFDLWVLPGKNFKDAVEGKTKPSGRSSAKFILPEYYATQGYIAAKGQKVPLVLEGPKHQDAIRTFHAVGFENKTGSRLSLQVRFHPKDKWEKLFLDPGAKSYVTNGNRTEVSPQVLLDGATAPGFQEQTYKLRALKVTLKASENTQYDHARQYSVVLRGNLIKVAEAR